ncbi:MAG: VOC family protein, partial [Cyanobium sp.]
SHWRVPLPGGGGLELYAPSRRRPAPAPGGRLAPCLRRSGDGQTLADWLDAACALGAALVEGPRQEPFGWEAWLRDPEGNPLLLLVPAA